MEMDESNRCPKSGILIHGLALEGCSWDSNRNHIVEFQPGSGASLLPVIHCQPVLQ